MAAAVVWVVLLLGLVDLAVSVCAYLMFMCICVFIIGEQMGEGGGGASVPASQSTKTRSLWSKRRYVF